MINDLAICVLSWKAHDTVSKTLESYAKASMFDLFAEKLIFFQEIGEEDKQVAAKYNLPYVGVPQNIGIENGWREALSNINSKYVLFLENDCQLVINAKEAERQITLAYQNLAAQKAHVVRLRHRWNRGQIFGIINKFNRYDKNPILQLLRPRKFMRLAGNAFYKYENPEERYPKIFANKDEHGTYFIKSKHLGWTNQSIMFEKDWAMNVMLERVRQHPSFVTLNGFQNIESAVNKWWRKQDFTVAVNLGAFSHQRYDRDETMIIKKGDNIIVEVPPS